ncbi:MAG: glycine--tRNA ligase [Gemmataceae bacterium]|nr:glycine--tRNA ligase [Gemmataceae bacterium]
MDMEKLVALCRRRGFIFGSSEIYGGLNGFWDYGPLGVELKKNIKEAWWQDMVRNPPPGPDGQEISMVGVDCAIIMNPKVWEASGHVATFADPTRKCPGCGRFVRADQLWEILAQSTWMNSLIQEFAPVTGAYDSPKLMKWAQNKGKKLAPNLALVRNPHVVLAFLATRVNGQPEAPPDLKELTSYLATEQLHATGLQDPCPECGAPLLEAKPFSLMFETYAGLDKAAENKVYLRPETAQGIFANFKNVLDSTRLRLPFGIAQIGKAFRNEVTPRNYTFRSREFEQMEIEFFCHPDESMKWYQYWRDVRKQWYTKLGIKSERLVPREQGKEEIAFYSIGTTDIEYLFPFAPKPQELEGVAHRGAYDLTQHMEHSKKDLRYFDEEAWNALLAQKLEPFKDDKKRREEEKKKLEQAEKSKYLFIPHVIEPSAGADRFTLAVLCEAYAEDTLGGEARTVMRFHPRLAPIKAAILPLVNKEGMPEKAHALYRELKNEFNVFYDDGGAIGRRYRRQDEAGTPYCFTIDGQTLQDQTVTIRERDDGAQRRVPIDRVADELRKALRPS